ncbi:MAG: Spi family protease inhibitor, partial [Bacteroidales bacterium]|nr:Spi family protease inhibitor [Bacteroidales bacterium]
MKSLAFTLLLSLSGLLFSNPIDSALARKIAHHFFRYKWGLSNQLSYYPLNSNGLIHLFYDNTNMILIAGDDAVQPILGYSSFFSKDEEKIPFAFKNLIKYYEEQISHIQKMGIEPTFEIKQLWQDWLNGTYQSPNKSSVPPLLHCLWDQGKYYNSLCPYLSLIHI